VIDLIRERGPVTVAAFMDLALYDPQFGYYARATRRSGRTGDFFTSVDVSSLFGELLARQVVDMAGCLDPAAPFDLIEAGASDGRLSADMMRALRARDPRLYERTRLHLVEASVKARAAHLETLGETADRLQSSSDVLPDGVQGVIIANELLDAFPVHQVVRREAGLREVFVETVGDRLRTREDDLSTTELAEYLEEVGATLAPGWRAEINLRARKWIIDAARILRRGFMILIDYGHEANDLYTVRHSGGTLTTFSQHVADAAADDDMVPPWLRHPGEQDITAHVDFTMVRATAEAHGLSTIGFLDQTYFLLGLLDGEEALTARQRLGLKTLIMPGGLGSTMKVLLLGKDVGHPQLRGCSYRVRVT
jgi:SAM-dependent MidA family methyltransferase